MQLIAVDCKLLLHWLSKLTCHALIVSMTMLQIAKTTAMQLLCSFQASACCFNTVLRDCRLVPALKYPSAVHFSQRTFCCLQELLGIPQSTIKATVLIETLPAAFEMDEILYELRQHSAGLNCGRWDYIFSFIKTTRADPAFVMPDRSAISLHFRAISTHCTNHARKWSILVWF